ncbi:hypothetical protein HK104_003652 [Borealophlyctis nickersoniae]|nr:hypothetical protein HK104_003652 [Borealophlyctis nickersoniae]
MYAVHNQPPSYAPTYPPAHDDPSYNARRFNSAAGTNYGYEGSQAPSSGANYAYSTSNPSDYAYSSATAQRTEYDHGRNPSVDAGTYRTNASSTRPTSLLLQKGPAYNPVIDPDVLSVKSSEGKTRFCCGCFASRLACCACWLGALFLLLVGLGLTAFFLWPRIPDVKVSDPYVPTNVSGFKLPANSPFQPGFNTKGDPASASAAAPFEVTLGLASDIAVLSDNYIDVVASVDILGTFLDTSNKDIPPDTLKATGNLPDVTFKGHGSNTTATLPIWVSFKMDRPLTQATPQQTAFITVLQQVCGIAGLPATPGAKFQMNIETTVDIKLVSWTGFKPKINKKVSFGCPGALQSGLGNLNLGGVS